MPTFLRRPVFAAPVAALLLLALGAPAADPAPKTDAAAVPPVPTVPAETPAADLLKSLNLPATASSVVERDGKALWVGEDPTLTYQVVAVDKDNNAQIATDIGQLTVARKLMLDNRTDAIAALPTLIAHAKGSQIKADGLLLREGILTGMHLFSAQTLVLSEGVLQRKELAAVDRAGDRSKVNDAAAAIEKTLATSVFDEPGRRSLIDILHKLAKPAGNEQVDEVAPDFARRLVRGGWLRKLMPDQAAAVTALEQAISAAEKFQPVTLYDGTGLKLAEVSDSFDRTNRWILTTPTRVAYVQPHEEPLYYWALGEPGPTLAVDLPAGADPTAINDNVLGVRLFQGATLLASWNAKSGFTANAETWRQAYPGKPHRGVDPNSVADFMPPHVVLTALNGDVVRLYTAHGTLTAPKDGSTQDAERFLAEAAKSLPDPAHLDLIGEYILSYVYDSPDSRFPFLVGNKQVKGDIHQTALQTISTATCGMIRGDCDDLSELYQTIAERQGRTAMVW
jgi:hypothetical protein